MASLRPELTYTHLTVAGNDYLEVARQLVRSAFLLLSVFGPRGFLLVRVIFHSPKTGS